MTGNHIIYINPGNHEAAHYLKKIVDEIHGNYSDKKFRIEKLSSKNGISYTNLYEMFMQNFKICPKKFLENVRLEFALKQLSDGKTKIVFISDMAGYGCARTFRYVFKKRLNISPAKCREKILKSKDENYKLENLINKIWD